MKVATPVRGAFIALLMVSLPIAAKTSDDKIYDLVYRLEFDPDAGGGRASLRVKQDEALLRRLRFSVDDHVADFKGDGEVERDDDEVTWRIPDDGGVLRWKIDVENPRGDDAYDAYIADDWAMFRADDVFPSARATMAKGATSAATFEYTGPDGWSILTPFPEKESPFTVVNDERRFDRPTGWLVLGRIGVRREVIADVQVAVGGPVGQGVRRMDVLALLNWVLPGLVEVIPDFPKVLSLVSAGDPMWRGGLSGPNSFYMHASRPLLSENGTSTLVHELMHIGLSRRAVRGDDWIIEGLAEFYSVELLRRTGTVTPERHTITLDMLREWSQDAEQLKARRSKGPITAKAVLVMRAVDQEIRKRTDGDKSLDDVMRALSEKEEPLGLEELRRVSEDVAGEPLDALRDRELPGYG